jgi:hypothetical protein
MNLTVEKRQITESDVSLLEGEYLATYGGGFSKAYELTPHHTTFSKAVSMQLPNALLVVKVPHDSNGGRNYISAELIVDTDNFTIDSFSTIYEIEKLVVTGEQHQYYNPNYSYGGIFAFAGDTTVAKLNNYHTYADHMAPLATEALGLLGATIASDPGDNGDGMAVVCSIQLPQLGGNAAGPRDRAVVYSTSPLGKGILLVSYYININSNYYRSIINKLGDNTQIDVQWFNTYTRIGLEVMGWSYEKIRIPLSAKTSTLLKDPTPSLPDRRFVFTGADNLLKAYKDWAGDDNIQGIPIAHQSSQVHLFAGGYHSDRWDTADFYHAEDFKGGPLNQPIPHPALMTEMLSTNSLFNGNTASGPADDGDEFIYKRHHTLEEKHFSPNYIITKEAMEFAGYGFYSGGLDSNKNIIDCLFAKPSHHRVGEAPNTSSSDKLRIRNYSEDKYLIKNNTLNETEERHLMINKNHNVSHDKNDKSVEQALRYFGYIPFGGTKPTHTYPGRFDSAILIEKGKKQLSVRGFEIFENGPNILTSMDDYRIYISANASSVHRDLGLTDLGDSDNDGKGLLYKYFMAESVISVIDVGDDPLDLEDASSEGLSISQRCLRRVLVLHKDFEI